MVLPGESAAPAVVVEDLRKSYGDKPAVDGLNFTVDSGEIFALLGPNGAGKTTTIEILEGYRKPDAGIIRVLGLDPATQAGQLKPLIGAMLQEGGVYPTMTARQVLALFANYYPNPLQPDSLLSLVGMEDQSNVPYRRLSGGQKQR